MISDPRIAVSVADAARSIGISRSFLYFEIAQGKICGRKIGRRTVIEVREIERYIAALPSLSIGARYTAA